MAKVTELGFEVVPGITIPWNWLDGVICGLIAKGDAEILTDPTVAKLDNALQTLVDNTTFEFDNAGKEKLQQAFTMSMVKRFMPELLNP